MGMETMAPPGNSCVKLSTIQVPTGEDGDVEGFAVGSAVGIQGRHRNEAQLFSFLLKCQVMPRCFRDKFPISATLSQVTSLNHSHIRSSLESVLHISFVTNTRKNLVHIFN